MENSAVTEFDYTTHKPFDFKDYWQLNEGIGTGVEDPNSFRAKVLNFFTGKVTSAKQSYENYLSDFEFKRNQQEAAKANAAKLEREDSEVQRRMQDYEKAGLNPYLLLNSGSVGASTSSATQYAQYKRQSKASDEKQDDKLFSSALKILALLILKKS